MVWWRTTGGILAERNAAKCDKEQIFTIALPLRREEMDCGRRIRKPFNVTLYDRPPRRSDHQTDRDVFPVRLGKNEGHRFVFTMVEGVKRRVLGVYVGVFNMYNGCT